MDERDQMDDARWEHVMEHLDLLFAQVGDINTNQQKISSAVQHERKSCKTNAFELVAVIQADRGHMTGSG